MNNIWVLSDTHFGHKKLLLEGHFTEKDVEKVFTDLKCIDSTDMFIHLGDVSFANHEYWHKHLTQTIKCPKILILGNHDNESIFWNLKKGWNAVCNRFEIERFGKRWIFTHALLPHKKNGCVNVCGHMHFPFLHITSRITLNALELHKLDKLNRLYDEINQEKTYGKL